MINISKIKSYLEDYKNNYFLKHWDDEKYKWQAIKHFQDNWDIEAENFKDMFINSTDKTKNLLASAYFFPRRMIINYIEKDEEYVRDMFKDLYNKDLDLYTRIDNFINKSEYLREKYNEGSWNQHFQNLNSVSTYLWLRYPDKYYIYKYSEYKKVANKLDSEIEIKTGLNKESLLGGLSLYNKLREVIKTDKELIGLLDKSLDNTCYEDPNYVTLTIDFGYYISNFTENLENKRNVEEIEVKEWIQLIKNIKVFDKDSISIIKNIYLNKDKKDILNNENILIDLSKRIIETLQIDNTEYNNPLEIILDTDKIGRINIGKLDKRKENIDLRKNLKKVIINNPIFIEKPYLNKEKSIWKVSHSPSIFTEEEREELLDKNIIVVSKNTGKKGFTSMSQGDDFLEKLEKDDLFYLCYGNNIKLLGRILDDKPSSYKEKGDDWYKRSYEIIKLSQLNKSYDSYNKWWTPNHNSTFIKIGEEDYSLFEEAILSPYFNLEFKDLINKNNNYGIKIKDNYTDNYTGNYIDTNKVYKEILSYNISLKNNDKIILFNKNKDKILGIGEIKYSEEKKEKYIKIINENINIDEIENKLLDIDSKLEGNFFRITDSKIIDIYKKEKTYLDKYNKEKFLEEVFMTKEDYETLLGLLKNKKNIILQGPPGVGKTFTARRLAYSIMGEKDKDRVEFIQFHQNYSYEDFIMGYKPTENNFELDYGIFYRFCKKAEKNPEKDYFFIIDEINRGNLSKIFGEVLMLIEKGYRGSENEIKLAYSKENFSVPKNIYLIGTMNTADRSLAMIDYALRRRFSFFEMKPGFRSQGFINYINKLENKDNIKIERIITLIEELNKEIKEDVSLGSGFCIGHSYLCGRKEYSKDWIEQVIKYDIIPMLSEYWFDNENLYNKWKNKLIGEI